MDLASNAVVVERSETDRRAAGEQSGAGSKRWALGRKGWQGPAVVVAALLLAGSRPAPVRAKQMAPQQPASIPGQPPMQPSMQPNPMDTGITGVDPATSARMQEQRQHALEDDRHRRIVADANKLLELATQLKAEVDKSSKNELSVAVIDKAGQIEKLSHDLKERMRN